MPSLRTRRVTRWYVRISNGEYYDRVLKTLSEAMAAQDECEARYHERPVVGNEELEVVNWSAYERRRRWW